MTWTRSRRGSRLLLLVGLLLGAVVGAAAAHILIPDWRGSTTIGTLMIPAALLLGILARRLLALQAMLRHIVASLVRRSLRQPRQTMREGAGRWVLLAVPPLVCGGCGLLLWSLNPAPLLPVLLVTIGLGLLLGGLLCWAELSGWLHGG